MLLSSCITRLYVHQKGFYDSSMNFRTRHIEHSFRPSTMAGTFVCCFLLVSYYYVFKRIRRVDTVNQLFQVYIFTFQKAASVGKLIQEYKPWILFFTLLFIIFLIRTLSYNVYRFLQRLTLYRLPKFAHSPVLILYLLEQSFFNLLNYSSLYFNFL